uniref:Ulp1 protease family, C-terminal catalytic domain-containing protein n=1 Tax=Tanacetum cinerariifolium TaxID=118510 RepID=A0A699JVX5_TANCI|nr:ulp1 protease family, C-terminal catalytic domain-containing protein [Tanacetum cinerariifolium]
MEERFEVNTLCSMIDFDIPKEQMHNQLPIEPMIPEATVQGCNHLETAQSIITEYESQHAIHDHLDTLSMKNDDSVQGSNDAMVDVNHIVAVNSLRVPLERDHKVSRYLEDPYMIQPDSTEPNHKVCARHKKNKKRCMTLTTPDGKLIPAWTEKCVVGCLIRLAEADWTIVGPFFNTFMLRYDLSCCYADGVTYGVPWFAQSMEKVRCSYILPLDDLTVEYQKWWLDMRACYATQIPKLLLKTEVLDKKNIDPANYFITYWYAVNVPRQGDAYGDFGIWVM